MTTMVAEVYEAFIEAGATENKAVAAAKSIAEIKQDNRFEKVEKELIEIRGEIIGIKGEIRLIKWMLGVLISMNIGIFLMLIRIISK